MKTKYPKILLSAKTKKPILGICRGCQLINVVLGGSLHQNISNNEEHSSFSDYDLVHKVKVAGKTFLSEIYSEEFYVNSLHHQAIKEPGKDIDVIATACNGTTVEAIKHKELPVYAVQWHPERMCFEEKWKILNKTSIVLKLFDGIEM